MSLEYFFTQAGISRPIKILVPMMAKFLDDVKEMGLRLERVTPINIPIIVIKDPPSTGYGMDIKTADNFPKSPKMTYMTPHVTKTLMLATYKIKKKQYSID
jgi:hypothetical protein